MKIQTNDLLISSKKNFIYDIVSDDVTNMSIGGRKVELLKPAKILVQITKTDTDELLADIDITVNAKTNCVRCLDDIYLDATVNISGKLVEKDEFLDEDVIIITDQAIDTDKLLEDAVFELLNDNLFCDESCKGLCQTCGVNLNHEMCNCSFEGTYIDPRLEGLKNFFN